MNLETLNWSYYTLIGSLLFLPLLFVFLMSMIDLKKTMLFFRVLFSNKYFYKYSVDTNRKTTPFYLCVLGAMSVVLALLLSVLKYGSLEIYQNLLKIFSETIVLSVAYFFVKRVVAEMLHHLLGKNAGIKQMINLEFSYLASVFVVVYLLDVYVFLHLDKLETMVNYILITSLFLYVIRAILMFVNNKNLLSSKIIYIILYLCALEILPFIYIFKRYIA